MNSSVVLPFHASYIDGQYQLLPVDASLSSFGSLSTFALMKFCEALSSTQPQFAAQPDLRFTLIADAKQASQICPENGAILLLLANPKRNDGGNTYLCNVEHPKVLEELQIIEHFDTDIETLWLPIDLITARGVDPDALQCWLMIQPQPIQAIPDDFEFQG